MNKILFLFIYVLALSLYSEENIINPFLALNEMEPDYFDARKYYDEFYFSESEGRNYINNQNLFLSRLNMLVEKDTEIINKLTGTWNLINNCPKNRYDYIDFKSSYERIGFNFDDYYGFSFNFFGSGNTHTAYKNQDYLVSTVGTMGWIGPILRYEFVEEKMYLYILNMDKWELADFHEGGKNYFIKTSPNHTPLTP